MTRAKLYPTLLVALSVLLVASLAGGALILRALFLYQDNHPPSSPFVAGKCKAPALVAHWNFDEVTNAETRDSTPYANHARLEVTRRPLAELRYGLPRHVAGIRGKALELEKHHWVSAENNDCFTTDRFTFAAWVWLEETGNTPTIASKSSWTHDGWWLMTTTKGPQANDRYLDLGISWGSGRTHIESGYQLALREWHHIALTVDNTRGEVRFFIDGKPFGPRHTNVPRWLVNWDQNFVVGDYDGSTRWPWIGKLDDVQFYNYALPDTEAAALYLSSGGSLSLPGGR